jgi:hypothetical protein
LHCCQDPKVQIDKTWFKTKMVHSISKVVAKACTSTFESIQRSDNECNHTSIRTKLRSQDSVDLLSVWSCDLQMIDV